MTAKFHEIGDIVPAERQHTSHRTPRAWNHNAKIYQRALLPTALMRKRSYNTCRFCMDVLTC